MGEYQSWGIYGSQVPVSEFYWQDELMKLLQHSSSSLVVGRRRSYGDVCLNSSGNLITTSRFDRVLRFDTIAGEICCTSGMSLAVLNSITLSRGWFTPVSPGTQNVTVGGMIANDVHGKNHHIAGTFGNHVLELGVLRHTNEHISCSPVTNAELFKATIGGLGLTGAITYAKFKLIRVESSALYTEDIPFADFDQFQQLSQESDQQWPYTVAWLDAASIAGRDIRGIYSRGKHIERDVNQLANKKKSTISIPFVAPNILLNRYGMHWFNQFYYKINNSNKDAIKSIDAFFYPLDRLEHWNRLYGKRGFFQYQCVVPDNDIDVLVEMLSIAKACNQVPYLSVLKKFGDIAPAGMMSFPMPGLTLAIDFPNLGQKTLDLFNEFDKFVLSAKGKLYPAKDARMSAATFQSMYPQFREFSKYRDATINSDFWRRVSAES